MDGKVDSIGEKSFIWILTCKDEITTVSNNFENITEFDINEVQGKKIDELWKMLRLTPYFNIESENSNKEYLLFTKSNLIKEVEIYLEDDIPDGQAMYFIKKNEPMSYRKRFSFIEQIMQENAFGVGIFKMPEVKLIQANQKFLDILDEPFNRAENSIGRFIGDIVTGWKGSDSEKIWGELVSEPKFIRIDEYKYERLKRGERYFNSSLIPVFEGGKLIYYAEIIDDVTENVLNKRKVEAQNCIIKEQHEKLKAIIENMSDALFIAYGNGDFQRINKSARSFVPEYIENKVASWLEYAKFYDINGKELQAEETPIPRITRGEKLKDLRITMDDGNNRRHFLINGTPVLKENGEFQFGVICSKDVTEHVINQGEMIRRMSNFHQIMNNIDIPILRISYPDFNILGYNKRLYEELESLEGDSQIDFNKFKVGSNLFDSGKVFKMDRFYESIMEVERTRNITYIDKAGTIQNGERRIFKIIFQPLFDSNDKITEIIITSYDVTKIVMEKEGAEKLLKMQEQFFSFISHEFKTPLSVISAAVQAIELMCGKELGDRERSYINKIKRSTLQQIRLVNNLLDIIRADSGYLKLHKKNRNVVQVTELIINSVEPYASEKGVTIDFYSDEDNITTAIDDEKYERVLLNLLSNAIKFTPSGKNIYVDIFREGDGVVIEVKDEGIGIPKGKQQIIFNRFEQAENGYIRNSNGTGIGLCLVKLLVEAMEGNIFFESQEGEGTCFKIMLPVSMVQEEENQLCGLMDNRLVEVRNIEFSNIYLE